ncbi:MAG TPA: phosphatidate cytidylyltransferase [Thermomicrobiales bacterium]|nr:phosphatidate cytidylyltransferase [Thermomicrobiales bacterium]
MRQRAISSIVVVLIGLVPAIVGGPLFAIVFALIAMLAYHELIAILGLEPDILVMSGYALVAFAAIAAYSSPTRLFPVYVALSIFLPVIIGVLDPQVEEDILLRWGRVSVASLYVGIAAFAAIALRQLEGVPKTGWFDSIGSGLTFTDRDTSIGLAWLLLAILVTWLSDTVAYLVGRSVGRTPLIPRVSPKKTVEGAVGGFIAAGLTALICILVFGIDINPLTGLLVGLLLGGIGMLGDLCESLLKRKAGIKDSGTLIPGHGGVLDRIDALIFVIVATWLIVPFLT